MASVSISDEALAEYDTPLRWYLGQDAGAARRFDATFDRAVAMLATFPEIGVPCDDRCRFWSIRKFPYGLVYYFDGVTVRIVAVPHDHQLPGYWADRT